MNIYSLLEEYSLEINDVRWYLSGLTAFKLLEYRDDSEALTRYICSGELEEELYNMEEKFLSEIQDNIDRNLIDEVNVREILIEIVNLKSKRS